MYLFPVLAKIQFTKEFLVLVLANFLKLSSAYLKYILQTTKPLVLTFFKRISNAGWFGTGHNSIYYTTQEL
jgi:hypothetical protein